MIGILLDNNDPIIEFPVEVDIDSQNIGGPSAGQMFALQIINQLTEDDITHGRRIAGTGTIARDGTVGPIGGVRQKVHAAIDAGATVILVPAGNYDDAIDAAGNEIVVVKVVTIDDSLDYLASLDEPEGPQ
jgi:PDZ domain-containing protein